MESHRLEFHGPVGCMQRKPHLTLSPCRSIRQSRVGSRTQNIPLARRRFSRLLFVSKSVYRHQLREYT